MNDRDEVGSAGELLQRRSRIFVEVIVVGLLKLVRVDYQKSLGSQVKVKSMSASEYHMFIAVLVMRAHY